ncbi:MAG: ATP synthase subunit I [Clostridia bacterium]|nr:ATP synthase subunit I [Clostridia bacterium]MBR0277428.1 ATP synthase subunit I [Clostridia bacterium]
MPNSSMMKEIKKISLFTLGGIIVMVAVFAALGYFSWGVVVGGLLGGATAIINLFLLALTIEKQIKKGSKKGAQGLAAISYPLRMMFIAAVVVFAIKSPYLNYIAVIIPLIVPQFIIKILHIRSSSKEKKQDEC